jgi:hypothetical protein
VIDQAELLLPACQIFRAAALPLPTTTGMTRLLACLVLVVIAASAQAAGLTPVKLEPYRGPTKVALGSIQAELREDAVLVIAGKSVVLDDTPDRKIRRYRAIVEGNRAYFILEYAQTDPDEPHRTEVSIYNVKGRTDLTLEGSIGFAAIDLDKQDLAWRMHAWNSSSDGTWELLQSPTAFYVRVIDAAYAIAKRSGGYKWVLSEDALEGSLNARYLLGWKPTGTSLVFDYVNRVDYGDAAKPTKRLEIDSETGERVFRTLPAPKVPIWAIYTHQQLFGAPPAPAQPKDWDGVVLERTYLMWNTKTLEGVIINPQKSIMPQIVAAARSRKVGGRAVQWKYVIDLFAAVKTAGPRLRSEVLAGYKDPVAPTDEILRLAPGDLDFSGEAIGAAALAKQLGAATPATASEQLALHAAPIFMFRDDQWNLKLKWGPYVIHEERRDRADYKMDR